MGRYKSIIGNRMRSRKFFNQQTEIVLGCRILNRMLNCARPNSVRVTEQSHKTNIKDRILTKNASMHQRRRQVSANPKRVLRTTSSSLRRRRWRLE